MNITIKTLQAGILSLCLAAITSCSKDAQTPGSPSSPGLAKKIQKKWIIGGNKSVQADANIISLEFNNSNQAIVAWTETSNPGKEITKSYYYQVKDENNIEVKNFGRFLVDSITDNSARFSFTPTGNSTPIVLTATASTFSVGNSTLTNQLCRTWKLDLTKTEYFIQDSTGEFIPLSDTTFPGDPNDIITFTSSGTFFQPNDTSNTTGYWKWSANGNNILCIDDTISFECDIENQFAVSFIGNKLNFTFSFTNSILKTVVTFQCSPYTLTGGRTAVSSGSRSINPKFFQRKRPLTR